MPEYTVYEGIAEGNRFYSGYEPDLHKAAHLANGVLAYRILGHADTGDEAREIIARAKSPSPTQEERELIQALNYYIGFSGRGPTALDKKPPRELTALEIEAYNTTIQTEKALRRTCWREAVLEVTGEDTDETY